MNGKKIFFAWLIIALIVSVNTSVQGQSMTTIILNSTPECGGTPEGEGVFEVGVQRTISVTPLDGYQFVKWVDETGAEFNSFF